MVNDQTYPDIQKISLGKKPEITDKESRKELIEMAAEQFASLLWQQYLFKKRHKKVIKQSELIFYLLKLIDLLQFII